MAQQEFLDQWIEMTDAELEKLASEIFQGLAILVGRRLRQKLRVRGLDPVAMDRGAVRKALREEFTVLRMRVIGGDGGLRDESLEFPDMLKGLFGMAEESAEKIAAALNPRAN